MRDPEVGFASKRFAKRGRSFIELELLEERDAEIVRAIGLLARGDDGGALTAQRRGGEEKDGGGDLPPETQGVHPVPVESASHVMCRRIPRLTVQKGSRSSNLAKTQGTGQSRHPIPA